MIVANRTHGVHPVRPFQYLMAWILAFSCKPLKHVDKLYLDE